MTDPIAVRLRVEMDAERGRVLAEKVNDYLARYWDSGGPHEDAQVTLQAALNEYAGHDHCDVDPQEIAAAERRLGKLRRRPIAKARHR